MARQPNVKVREEEPDEKPEATFNELLKLIPSQIDLSAALRYDHNELFKRMENLRGCAEELKAKFDGKKKPEAPQGA